MTETKLTIRPFETKSANGSYVDINSDFNIWKMREPYFGTVRITDDLLNDAIAGLPQQEKVAFLQQLFGKDWQEHYQG